MSLVSDKLDELRIAAYAEREKEQEEYDEEELRDAFYQERRDGLISYCRPMQLWEYSAWLTGFMQANGKPTHFYDYATPGNWFTAQEDFTVLPLYGSRSVNIIVPVGVRFLGGPTGHNDIFITTDDGQFLYQGFHDSRPHNSPNCVPVFTDTETMD